jgi:hypothetical protein
MMPEPAEKLAGQSQRDAHSIVADAMFVDPAQGDFRVREGSPALALGFRNFPMDRFGVRKPELRAIARTPEIPLIKTSGEMARRRRVHTVWGAQMRDVVGLGDRSAYGLPDASGVLVIEVPANSMAARSGLQRDDVIIACNGRPVGSVGDLLAIFGNAGGGPTELRAVRNQKSLSLDIRN